MFSERQDRRAEGSGRWRDAHAFLIILEYEFEGWYASIHCERARRGGQLHAEGVLALGSSVVGARVVDALTTPSSAVG